MSHGAPPAYLIPIPKFKEPIQVQAPPVLSAPPGLNHPQANEPFEQTLEEKGMSLVHDLIAKEREKHAQKPESHLGWREGMESDGLNVHPSDVSSSGTSMSTA